MNILASYNWIREYVNAKTDPVDFARRVSLSGPGVERSHPLAPEFEKMVIGKIVAVNPHPDADRLRLVETNIGKRTVTVVCGGSNLEEGMKVLVALPGSRVRWHGEGKPVVLEKTKIRGVASEGMICGANEVGLEESFPHEEREILDLSWCKAHPGTSIAKALNLDDVIFDIEVTTNRPDAFSIIGLAREAAAILGGTFTWKESLLPGVVKGVKSLPINIRVDVPKKCTRYEAVVMTDVTVGPSPWWIKKRLQMAGIRPINTIVDITNYVMLEYGQPMHAFDYDALDDATIVVRNAKKGETIITLDDRTHELSSNHLVIADAKNPVAVAGVMGGHQTRVTETTKTVVFESATFDPVSVRRTARALTTHTDSSLRFEKGLPEDQTHPALARAVELCQTIAMGKVSSKVKDIRSSPSKKLKFPFRPEKAAELIGVRIPKRKMITILKSLGFFVQQKGKRYEVTVPYWRAKDIEDERDFSEEIARIYGYANLPSVLPEGKVPIRSKDPILQEEERLTEVCYGAGFTEIMTYSFVSGDLLEKTMFTSKETLSVSNPLSLDFEYMRPSLLPGILHVIAENQGLFNEGKIFEVSNSYFPKDHNLPQERAYAMVAVYANENSDRLFREVKGLFQLMYPDVASRGNEERYQEHCRWHPSRTVRFHDNEKTLAIVGEVHPLITKRHGIDGRVAILEIDLSAMVALSRQRRQYEPISQFPSIRRDLAFLVDRRVEYADIEDGIFGASTLVSGVELFDVYQGKGIDVKKKSVAVHMTFTHAERTLTTEEVNKEIERILQELDKLFGATVRT